MKFKDFCENLLKLESMSSRLEMGRFLASMLKSFEQLSEEEIAKIIYLMQSRIAPNHVSLEFNISEKTIKKILEQLYREEEINKEFLKTGDFGEAFYVLSQANKNKKLGNKQGGKNTIDEIYQILLEIAKTSGSGANKKKVEIIKNTLSSLLPVEGKFFIRILLQTMRLGFSDKTLIEALSFYLKNDKSLRSKIERTYGLYPDLGAIISKVIIDGEKALGEFKMSVGVPFMVKLVQREANLSDILKRYETVFIQPKFDGIRAQIHVGEARARGKVKVWEEEISKQQSELFVKTVSPGEASIKTVKIFSRNLEDLTEMFPDIVEIFQNAKKINSVILDSEIIARDKKTGRFLPFQETIKRKRKYGISEKVKDLPIEVNLFDVVYSDGQDLSHEKFIKRQEILKKIVKKINERQILLTETTEVKKEKDLEKVFQKDVKAGLEGIIAKDPESIYKVGTRNYDWIKYKRATRSELADTIDAVVMGFYKGTGKQAKFGIGAFLVGVLNDDGKIKTVAKVGTGVTEKLWKKIFSRLKGLQVKEGKTPSEYSIEKTLLPDYLVRPEVICVIEADEITKSPVHSSGYALRFPRLKVFDRIDKSLDQITTTKEVTNIYKLFVRQT